LAIARVSKNYIIAINMRAAIPFLVAMLITILAIMAIIFGKTLSILRRRHPEVYESLGRPPLFIVRGSKRHDALKKFFSNGNHKSLNDPALSRLYAFGRPLPYLWAVLFVLYMACLILSDKKEDIRNTNTPESPILFDGKTLDQQGQ
jgi:hypothetical protein